MTKRIVHLHLAKDGQPKDASLRLLGESFHIHSAPTGGDVDLVVQLVEAADAEPSVDAIALDGMPLELTLGRERMRHTLADRIAAAATATPLVDGGSVRGAFERWAIRLVQPQEPGLFSRKRILFAPGSITTASLTAFPATPTIAGGRSRSSTTACPAHPPARRHFASSPRGFLAWPTTNPIAASFPRRVTPAGIAPRPLRMGADHRRRYPCHPPLRTRGLGRPLRQDRHR